MSLMQLLKDVGGWLDHRLQLSGTIADTATHPVPRSSASWWYVFGSATFTVLILQFVTGLCLATVYAPTADKAWQSLIYLNYDQPLGWFIRALHGWGSNFMVGLVCIHMAQVFLFGAHKYPRELTWIAGVRAAAGHARAWRLPDRCCASIRMPTGGWESARRSRAAPRSSGPRSST